MAGRLPRCRAGPEAPRAESWNDGAPRPRAPPRRALRDDSSAGKARGRLDEAFENVSRRAGVDRLPRLGDAVGQVSRAAARQDRGARVEHDDVAAGSPPALEDVAHRPGVLGRLAAGDGVEGSRWEAQLLRIREPLLGAPLDDLDHPSPAGDCELVEPIVAVDDERALAAEADERLRDRLLIVAVGDAEKLPRGARRVGE